jgi:Ca2+-binding RTX toxin-like protein
MTTIVTISIDDPNGLDSNLIFFGTYQHDTNFTIASGGLGITRTLNGVTTDYRLEATGTGFASNNFESVGYATSLSLSNFFGSPLLMHAAFAVDSYWASTGGVQVSLDWLTPDSLATRILQKADAQLIFNGNVGKDTLHGSFWNDVLHGGPGGDTMYGNDGIDTLSYSFSSAAVNVNLATSVAAGGDATGDHFFSMENIEGSSFADVLTGDAGNNFIDGGLGRDTIRGGAGNDSIFGRDGGGTLYGEAGNDRIDGGVDSDVIYGGIGDDELRVGTGNNYAYGEAGIDNLLGDTGNDHLYGGADNDFLQGIGGVDVLDGGLGADQMSSGAGAAAFYVDNIGDQVLDFVRGDGDRVLTSISFALTAFKEIENFQTTNSAGLGAINLTGNGVAQTITGNNGVNIIDGQGGADVMIGLKGSDTYKVDDAADRVVESTGGGTDTVQASVSYALASTTQVEILATTNAASAIALDLTGNAFVQAITGNAGANILNGGAGNDTLTGLGGSDTFFFNSTLNGSTNVDFITDFSVAADTIQLENAKFTAITGLNTLTADQFVKNATGTAVDANDHIIYETDTGKLFYDSNGSGAGGSVLFATLAINLALTNADFFIV